MQTVRVSYPTDWPYANVYPFADWHIGDKHSLGGSIGKIIETVQNDPYGLVVLDGDLMNTAVRNSVSDIYSEVMSPMEQAKVLVDLLQPIKKKIIGATAGNHEKRIYKNDGMDMMRMVCREIGVEERYNPDGILIFLHFGTKSSAGKHGNKYPTQTYSIYATHGSGGGRKEGAKAIRLADMASIVDCDCYIHAHTHLPMSLKELYYRCNYGNSSVTPVERLFVNASAMLGYGGYGQAQEYKPNSNAVPLIKLDAKERNMTVTI